MTETLSLSLYKLGVTVNSVGPAAATCITGPCPVPPRSMRLTMFLMMNGTADPTPFVAAVACLASDESHHVTGKIIRAVAEKSS